MFLIYLSKFCIVDSFCNRLICRYFSSSVPWMATVNIRVLPPFLLTLLEYLLFLLLSAFQFSSFSGLFYSLPISFIEINLFFTSFACYRIVSSVASNMLFHGHTSLSVVFRHYFDFIQLPSQMIIPVSYIRALSPWSLLCDFPVKDKYPSVHYFVSETFFKFLHSVSLELPISFYAVPVAPFLSYIICFDIMDIMD